MIEKSILELRDKQQSAYHEAGHFTVAKEFKVAMGCQIFKNLAGGADQKYFIGKNFTFGSIPLLATSAIGWAGCLAEHLCEFKLEKWDSEIENIEETIMFVDFEVLSDSDKRTIASHPQRARSFAWAYRILKKRHSLLTSVAETLLNSGQYP